MGQYPTYLIHYGTPGQKWGHRRFQNEDGTWTSEGLERRRKEYITETRKEAAKVARIISGHYWNKDLSQDEMRKLVKKYKKFETVDEYAKKHPSGFKEFIKKVNKNDGFNKSADKLYEWRNFERGIGKDSKELYEEKAKRKTDIMDRYRVSAEKAETLHGFLDDINKKIDTYERAINTYLNSSVTKKTMKELKIELKDVYDSDKFKAIVKNVEMALDKERYSRDRFGNTRYTREDMYDFRNNMEYRTREFRIKNDPSYHYIFKDPLLDWPEEKKNKKGGT